MGYEYLEERRARIDARLVADAEKRQPILDEISRAVDEGRSHAEIDQRLGLTKGMTLYYRKKYLGFDPRQVSEKKKQIEEMRRGGIVDARREGKSLSAIGKEFGISFSRVRQIVSHEKYKERRETYGETTDIKNSGLAVRTKNCLLNAGLKDIREVAFFTEAEILRLPNFGKGSLEDLKMALSVLNLSLGQKRQSE